MRWICALLVAVLPLAAFAGPPLPIVPMIGTDGEPFEGYDELCGFPILETPLPQMARAMHDTRGTPVIVLDPVLRQPGHEARRVFLIAHECAHHRLQHTEDAAIRTRSKDPDVVRDQELSADCWAAEKLIAAGEERVLRLIMDDFFRQGTAPPGKGYPSGLQRSRLILRCAGLG
ncbi:MAG: ImmA/IrrE family metallo-endopeptidase [Pseudomonadota bacterium]